MPVTALKKFTFLNPVNNFDTFSTASLPPRLVTLKSKKRCSPAEKQPVSEMRRILTGGLETACVQRSQGSRRRRSSSRGRRWEPVPRRRGKKQSFEKTQCTRKNRNPINCRLAFPPSPARPTPHPHWRCTGHPHRAGPDNPGTIRICTSRWCTPTHAGGIPGAVSSWSAGVTSKVSLK